jgi:hypothetical protein
LQRAPGGAGLAGDERGGECRAGGAQQIAATDGDRRLSAKESPQQLIV